MGLLGVPGLHSVKHHNPNAYRPIRDEGLRYIDRGEGDEEGEDVDRGEEEDEEDEEEAPDRARARTLRPGLKPVAADALTTEEAQKYLPKTPRASLKVFFGKAWKANYGDAYDTPRSRIIRWNDDLDKRGALLEALEWIWQKHKAFGGERCPWDLSE